MNVIDWLKLPEVKDSAGKDAVSVTLLHRRIIQKKLFLCKLYADFYKAFKDAVGAIDGQALVEIGSGGGFIKRIIPEAKTSDIIHLPNLDFNLSADNMPIRDSSIDAFFLLNVLHHIAEPVKFFREAVRCLKPGGKIVMIEPANTVWGRFIYKNFHHEDFETSAGWSIRMRDGDLVANGALAWIIFARDNVEFSRRFPQLKIKRLKFHTPLRYLISGGVSMRQLLPSFSYPLIKLIELILSPLNKYVGMFLMVELERSL